MLWFRLADRHWLASALVFGLLWLPGCGFFADRETRMDHYVQALAEALERQSELSDIPTVEPLPRRRERVLDVPSLNLGLVDFLSLYGCDLQVVVGERTSVLGRVMGAGKRLEYEIRFLAAARDCLPEIENERRAEQVADVAWTKEEHLPSTIWNGLWGTEEMETLFSRSQGTLPEQSRDEAFAELADSLRELLRFLEELGPGQKPDNLDVLSANYQLWRSEALLGKLLRSAEALQTRLNDAAHLLEESSLDASICDGLGAPPQALYRELYRDEAGPRVARVQTHRGQVLPLLARLLEKPGVVIPEAMYPFVARNLEVSGETSVWADLDAAVRRHDRAWMQLISVCKSDKP